jgi:predicted ester cyclase
MGMATGMGLAFPDLNYNMKIVSSNENAVTTSTQLTGTHTADWDLSRMGMGVIPATGKRFSNPQETGQMTVEDGKIASFQITPEEGGGLAGIFSSLGIQPPAR